MYTNVRTWTVLGGLLGAGVTSTAQAQLVTASSVSASHNVLYATSEADGTATITEVDPATLLTNSYSLGPGVVMDLDKSQVGPRDFAAFDDGRVVFLDTFEEVSSPIGNLRSAALGLYRQAFGNDSQLSICELDDFGGRTCTNLAQTAPITDISIHAHGAIPRGYLWVVGGGEVRFFNGTNQFARFRTGFAEIGPNIMAGRLGPGAVGAEVGPCAGVDALSTNLGMLIGNSGYRLLRQELVPADVVPVARSTQAVLLGEVLVNGAQGDHEMNAHGEIYNVSTGQVVARWTGVSIFPDDISNFDFGSPVVALAQDASTVYLDTDGAGPTTPEVVSGDILPRVLDAHPNVTPPSIKRKSQGVATAHVEIPGVNVGDVDVSSVTLAGVSPAFAGGVEDYDLDGEPDLPIHFDRQALVSVLPNGTSQVELLGNLNDGHPFRGTATLGVH